MHRCSHNLKIFSVAFQSMMTARVLNSVFKSSLKRMQTFERTIYRASFNIRRYYWVSCILLKMCSLPPTGKYAKVKIKIASMGKINSLNSQWV